MIPAFAPLLPNAADPLLRPCSIVPAGGVKSTKKSRAPEQPTSDLRDHRAWRVAVIGNECQGQDNVTGAEERDGEGRGGACDLPLACVPCRLREFIARRQIFRRHDGYAQEMSLP